MYPTLVQISSLFSIKSLYFFSVLGLLISAWYFSRQALKNRLRLQFVVDIFPWLVLSGLLVGRLSYVLLNFQFYFLDFSFGSFYRVIAFWADQSFSFWGVVIGVILAFVFHANKRQENISKWADVSLMSFLQFMVFANFAAFLEGINFGRPTDAFWGVTFINNMNIKYLTPIHPTQLYGAFYSFLIFMYLLFAQSKYKNQIDGLVFYLGLMLFSFCKFAEGFFRGDDTVLKLFGVIRLTEFVFLLIGILMLNKVIEYQKRNHTRLLLPFEKILNLFSNKR